MDQKIIEKGRAMLKKQGMEIIDATKLTEAEKYEKYKKHLILLKLRPEEYSRRIKEYCKKHGI